MRNLWGGHIKVGLLHFKFKKLLVNVREDTILIQRLIPAPANSQTAFINNYTTNIDMSIIGSKKEL